MKWMNAKDTRRYRWKMFGRLYGNSYPYGSGKWLKRQYHKALRRIGKAEALGVRARKSVYRWISEANWKGW